VTNSLTDHKSRKPVLEILAFDRIKNNRLKILMKNLTENRVAFRVRVVYNKITLTINIMS